MVAHLNVSNICCVTPIPVIMPLPNQDLVSHIPDNFCDSFGSSIPEDDDDMLSDLAAEEDTTRPSDSSFLSVDLDEDAPLPEWAAPVVMATTASLSHTEVADAMEIDRQEPQEQDPLNLEIAAPSDITKPPASEKNEAQYDDQEESVKGDPRPNPCPTSPQATMTIFDLSMSEDSEDQDSPRFIAHAPVATTSATLPEPNIYSDHMQTMMDNMELAVTSHAFSNNTDKPNKL